jgi:hypothetical protein
MPSPDEEQIPAAATPTQGWSLGRLGVLPAYWLAKSEVRANDGKHRANGQDLVQVTHPVRESHADDADGQSNQEEVQ